MIIGARTAAWSGGRGWKNPYVTDGLIAMWDGEWNAGEGVHDASASEWVDLSGNGFNLEVVDGEWEDDALAVMAGSGDVVGARSSREIVTGSCTVEIVLSQEINTLTWSKILPVFTPFATLTVWGGNRSVGSMVLANNYPLTSQSIGGSISPSLIDGKPISLSLSSWINYSFAERDNIRNLYYRNGEQVARGPASLYTGFDTGFNVMKGLDDGLTRTFDCFVKSLRVYDGTLDLNRNASNFKVDAERFGIT